ncbi:hypothetical protein TTHERM_01364600 (macronuclear) [Tetrahymena thermophila SB210]|uniref:Uncharacterized protein n=1 Tax=Tetrahymena thermophila (strain SB210) TaxID=312017 RepID=Q24BU1_TETTS|nr:hypothetical protein TTHERM_01364600 [Tetrahymena thermophila SB210]EAS05246.2 hypothetical protein TTHERM_01364600 [Tetrahymena thermophila SB210]|eukprot:XP_001025491.2 hypothetical protein TTHERM_01364600 [Tetrahymena thermophila SB210]
MRLDQKTKYSEFLYSKQFELKKNPNLSEESYLTNQTNILVHSAPLKRQIQNNQQFTHFRRVVFFPTHFYEKNSFELKIGDKMVDLLQCMYVVTEQDYSNNKIVQIQLQNYADYNQNLPYYQVVCKLNDNHLEIQAGIVGDKYLILAIQSNEQINIKILNFDLTLVFEYEQKHNIEEKKNYFYHTNSATNYFDNEIDYCEPGIIYFLGTQILIRIDLNKQQVIFKVFEEQFKLLLRLMPITQSEFIYYFKNCDKNQLSGYNNNDKEFLILFAIINQKIYQINIQNLEIIRFTKVQIICKEYFIKPIYSVFPIPIQIKDRQRKEFSNWTFLFHAVGRHYFLQDWKEQNLFQIPKKQNFLSCNFSASQRIFSHQNGIFVLYQNKQVDQFWKRRDASAQFQIQISKKKGEKNFNQTLEQRNEQSSIYFSQNFYIKNFFHPILYKNELTYPTYMQTDQNSYYFISNFIAFHSFKEQANKQLQYQIKKLNKSDYQVLKDDSLNFFTYQNQTKILLFDTNQNEVTYDLRLQDNIQEYFFNQSKFEQIFITEAHQVYKICSYKLPNKQEEKNEYEDDPQIEEIKNGIKCYSQFTLDRKNNNELYLPIIYAKEQVKYFGILDLNQKKIIEQTVHLANQTQGLLSHYNEEKRLFTLLFFKKVHNSSYVFFYQLNMKNFDFKFVNMHRFEEFYDINLFSQYLKVKNDNFNVLIPNKPNLIIKFNQKKKFEIKKIIKNCLAKYEFANSYEQDTKRQYFFLKNAKNSLKIFYIGFYQGEMYKSQTMLSVYDIKQNSIQFINKDIIKNEEDEQQQQGLGQNINVSQLLTGEILVYDGIQQIGRIISQ